MRKVYKIALLGALLVTTACSATQEEELGDPFVLAEPVPVEPVDACGTDSNDDGIGGTGCQPLVARSSSVPR